MYKSFPLVKWYVEVPISPIITNYHYYLSSKNKNQHNLSLRKTINGEVNVICYYFNDIVTSNLRTISQNDFSLLTTLQIKNKKWQYNRQKELNKGH